MAVGTVNPGGAAGNSKRAVCLLTAAAATTSVPTTAAHGVPMFPDNNILASDTGVSFTLEPAQKSTLLISSSAGSGTMTGTFSLWGYLAATAAWYPIAVNSGNAIAETAADSIRYVQQFENLGHFDRLACQVVAIGGTSTAFEVYVVTSREV